MGMENLAPAVRAGKRYLNPVPTQVGSGTLFLKALYQMLTTRAERVPVRTLGPFHTDAHTYAVPPASGLRVTWLGHSSLLIEIDGMRVLIDPVWEPRASPFKRLGPKRFYASPLAIGDLPPIDVVLISHDHYDHFGAYTVRQLAGSAACARAHWITSKHVGALLLPLGVAAVQLHELDWTESFRTGALSVTALPARHFSGRSPFNRFETLWSSFVLQTPKHRIFYGADSGEWEGFGAVGRQYGPFDLTLLEIGAYDPLWADIHMGPDGAARTFQLLGGSGLLMPIHWGLFNLALHAWDQPIARICANESLPLWMPEPGLPTEVVPGVALRSGWWRA